MGASTIDKDKEMLKSMKSISTLLEKFIVSVTGTNGTGTVSGTNTSSRSNKAESDKALDKIEKNIRNQLLKGKLADWEIQQRRETFIGKVMENKIIRPFYLTFKSLQGHTANLFRDLRGAWSDVYGKVFSQITEAFRPITGTIMAIYNFAKGLATNVFLKIIDKLSSGNIEDIGDKIESTSEKKISVLENIKKWIIKIHGKRKEKAYREMEDAAVRKMYGADGGDMITPKFMTKWFRMMRRWLPIQFRIRDRWEKAKSGMHKALAFGKSFFGKKKEEGEKKALEEKKQGFMDVVWKILKTVTSPLFKILGGMLILGVVNKIFPQVGEFLSNPATWTTVFEKVGEVFIYMKEKISSGLLGFWNVLLGEKVAIGKGESIFVKIPIAIGEAFHKAWTEGNTTAKIGAEVASWFFAIWGVSKLGSVLKLIAGAVPGIALKISAAALTKSAVALTAAAAKLGGGSVTDILTGKGGKLGKFARVARFLTNPATLVALLAAGSTYAAMDDRENREAGDVFVDPTGNLITVDKEGNEISADQYEESQKQTKVLEKSTGYLEQISDFFKKIISPTEAAASIIPPSTGVSNVPSSTGVSNVPSSTESNIIGKVGGSRSWRNNNPGNLEYNEYTKSLGAVGSDGRFAIFPTEEIGENAQKRLLFYGKNYKNLSLTGAINRYAPKSENDTNAYIQSILKQTGLSEKLMKDYTPEEQNKIQLAMKKHEVWKVGTGASPSTTTAKMTELLKGGKEPGANVAEVKKQEKSLTLMESMNAVLEKSKAENASKATLVASNVSNTAVSSEGGSKGKGMDDLPRSISDLFGLQQAVILNSIG